MYVKLIDYPLDPALLVACGGRICYSDKHASDIYKMSDDEANKMVQHAIDSHHDSLFEHVNFTFLIEDVSRVLSHQLVRHRIMSPHQRSQRYVTLHKGEYVTPKSIEENPEAKKIYDFAVDQAAAAYQTLIDMGIPKEDARYIYPNAAHTQLIITINGRSLQHMLGLRLCNRAQGEIREMAELMLKELRRVFPEFFNHVGPNCYMMGHCPEGKMSCGKMNEMQEKYKVD
jgi:thymidylate synthase (FAD)